MCYIQSVMGSAHCRWPLSMTSWSLGFWLGWLCVPWERQGGHKGDRHRILIDSRTRSGFLLGSPRNLQFFFSRFVSKSPWVSIAESKSDSPGLQKRLFRMGSITNNKITFGMSRLAVDLGVEF